MKLRPKTTISSHFRDLEDPRVDRTKRHQLIDIITITICAVISGADTWVDIEAYGQAKYKWLKKFLELPNGIPSHDPFALGLCPPRPRTITAMFSGMGALELVN